MTPVIMWFRRNLRIADNAALDAAAASGAPIIPIYVIDELDTGGASRWWLHHSLQSLAGRIASTGGRLIIRRGDPAEIIAKLAHETSSSVVHTARRYEPAAIRQEAKLAALAGIDLRLHADSLINEPEDVRSGAGTPFKVFTPFYKTCRQLGTPAAPDSSDAASTFHNDPPPDDEGALQSLLPTPDWAGGMRARWQPGESGAQEQLDHARRIASNYDERRDRPDIDGTSRLSPHLHFGELSVRQVFDAISRQPGAEALIRQLYWRDFSYHLLAHFPHLPDEPLREDFAHFPWVDDELLLDAWQRGKTGYPIVDAGMRQLWTTGWMHNRVRMIVASFLVKHLLIPWQRGADWFLDTLVDADLANNSASWQWVAGSGTDAAPYFRIFNPILQGKKFDPLGDYVRSWVPELERMPAKVIHEPWTAERALQRSVNTLIGEDYPAPIVDHGEARQRALDAYQLSRDLLHSGASRGARSSAG